MKTFLIILAILAVGAAVYYFLWKKGKINDRDKDFIPDEVEDAADKVKKTAKEVKRRAKRVKEEIGDVVDELKEAVDQAKDIKDAAKGKPRRGRKPKSSK